MLRKALALGVVLAVAAACGRDAPAGPRDGSPVVLGVVPAGGATNVDPAAPIVITFSRPMGWAAEPFVFLYEGGVNGPLVAGTATWSADRATLTFTPAQPLESQTTYALRFGGGMVDANGNPLNYGSCQAWGGQAGPRGQGMVFLFKTA